jgi:hypothetical protein
MPGAQTITPRIDSTSLDALLDLASATGGRVTWGRTRLLRRHWVAMEFLEGRVRVRRARTRAEAADRLLRDICAEPERYRPRPPGAW